MSKFRGSALNIGLAVVLLGALVGACSDDSSGSLSRRNGAGGSSSGSSGSTDPNNPNGTTGTSVPNEEALFRALEPDMQKKCGGACHTDGTYKPEPPEFLAPPDAYKSIKSHPGLITRDVYQSALLTKGAHAGPAVSSDPDFEKKVIAWLEAESLAIQSQRLPTTDPFTVANGANDIDMTKACSGGLTGVHLKFTASLVGDILSLSGLTITAPAGTDVHILKPKFYREPGGDVSKEVADPADSFSNTDTTVPGGQDSPLPPGSVFFTGTGFTPYDLANDKIRVEVQKLEPGKVSVVQAAPTCKNVAGFVSNVLPALKGTGFTPNCANCHGNGLAGLSLNGNDNSVICQQVLGKLNQTNIAQSLIITKLNGTMSHGGGQISNATAWQQLFTNNQGVFF